MYFLKIIFFIAILIKPFIIKANIESQDNLLQCAEIEDKKDLKNGWYLWEPYQYNKLTDAGFSLTGMDIQLVRTIAEKVGVTMNYEQVGWGQHQQDLKDGKRDVASGSTYTPARAEFVYFTVPYRFEENSLFILNDSEKEIKFSTISEFLAQVRLQNFRLGITKGFIYADPQINLFVNDKANKDIIVQFKNDIDALEALVREEIDGFISDRVVGSAAILNKKANSFVRDIQLNIKIPIHLMFSKKTISIDLVDRFNQEIKKFTASNEYKNIVKTYLYPVMLIQTIDSAWFYYIGVIGIIAFAISGVVIAAKENATLFGTFLFAMLPSVGGCVMRDVLINRDEVGLFFTPSYMYYILIVVLIGFFTVRLFEYYNKEATEDRLVKKFWTNILVICDAMGTSAFIVTGVSIAIMARIEPIELWGPFFAFLTANGGGILRDLLRKKRKILCLSGPINAESCMFWGLVFSIYLDINVYNLNSTGIRNVVIIVSMGAFITRMIAYYLDVPNVQFRAIPKKKKNKLILQKSLFLEKQDSSN